MTSDVLRVDSVKMAIEIAIEAARSMWRYTIPSSFYEVDYDKKGKSWRVEANYFEKKFSFKIDAVTGNVFSFKAENVLGKNRRHVRKIVHDHF